MAPLDRAAYPDRAAGGDLLQRICGYVQTHPGADAGEIALAVPAIRGAVSVALRRLERAGVLEVRAGRYRSLKAVDRVA